MREQEAMASAVRDGTCEESGSVTATTCKRGHTSSLDSTATLQEQVPPPGGSAGDVTSADSQFLLESQNDLSKLGAQQRVI